MKCVRPNVVRTPYNPTTPRIFHRERYSTDLSHLLAHGAVFFAVLAFPDQQSSQVAGARLNISGHNVVKLGDERVTSIFRVHQV